MLSAKKPKTAEKSRQVTSSDSSSSENEEDDRKNSKKSPTKSSVKRPKTPTKAKKVQAKSTSKKAKKDDNQPIYSKNTSDTSSEGESSDDSDAAEKRPIKAKNKSKAAQGKISLSFSSKGHIISAAIYLVLNSSNKTKRKFCPTNLENVVFFGRIENKIICFQD